MGTVKLKIALDAGNGMASLIIKPLFEKLAIDYIPLFFDINGSFPGRGSDPLGENALNPLKNAIINNNAELGIAFDGDADRMSVLDERGNIISPQFVLALLWQSIKSILSKPKVVYDSRFSRSVREFFGRQGIRSKVGHTNISRTMKDCRAAIGGETSGHFFFREMNYTESSALAVLRMLKVLSGSKKTISELVKPYDKYFYSGEVDVELLSNMDSNKILEMLKGKYENGRIDEFDGLTGDFSEWWFNVRSSNTEPLLRLVVEANTKELMDQKVSELVSEIKKAP